MLLRLGFFRFQLISAKVRWGTMRDNNIPTVNERLPQTTEISQIINDFLIRREILNMFKIQGQILKIANVSSEGLRSQKRRSTMIYYQLPFKTIFQNCYSSVIARLISCNSPKCEAALNKSICATRDKERRMIKNSYNRHNSNITSWSIARNILTFVKSSSWSTMVENVWAAVLLLIQHFLISWIRFLGIKK